MSRRFKVALGQINPTVGDRAGNLAKLCAFIDQAGKLKADLVVFPEMALTGYPVWDLATNEVFVKENLESLRELRLHTKSKRTAVVVGYIDRAAHSQSKNHNAAALVQNGKILLTQHKRLLPTYDVFLEEIFFVPGNAHQTVCLNGQTLGLSICEDVWDDAYSVKPVRLLAQEGAKIVINISASPFHRNAPSLRRDVISRKAREYGVWIVYVNQVGGQDDLIFDGRSFICDPQGNVRYQADSFREGLYYVELDLGQDRWSKRKGPLKSITKLISPSLPAWVERLPDKEMASAINEVYQALCCGLRDYVKKNGFQRVVLGLSGGVDSALVATIAADALGARQVVGIALPGPFSSMASLEDAEALAKALGIEFRVKSITEAYHRFVKDVLVEKKRRSVELKEEKTVTLAMENLQARLRGLELMYLSNDEGLLLLTTGNKSELAMGYSTLYGDMCGGLSVLGDVFKTDVYKIAKFRNKARPVIPVSILNKAPSAELRPNQKDQDSLPPYPVLDLILKLYIEENKGRDRIVAELKPRNISSATIRRVLSAVDHNEYKRRQLPPSLRITHKAWFGRRMPITNRFDQ